MKVKVEFEFEAPYEDLSQVLEDVQRMLEEDYYSVQAVESVSVEEVEEKK